MQFLALPRAGATDAESSNHSLEGELARSKGQKNQRRHPSVFSGSLETGWSRSRNGSNGKKRLSQLFIRATRISRDNVCYAFPPTIFGKFPKNIPRIYFQKLENKRLFLESLWSQVSQSIMVTSDWSRQGVHKCFPHINFQRTILPSFRMELNQSQ